VAPGTNRGQGTEPPQKVSVMPANEGLPPESGQGTNEGLNYEQSYNELRPQFTRTTQELSAAQTRLSEFEALFEGIQNPETRAQALEALGLELETGQPQGASNQSSWVDPLEEELHNLRGEFEELRSQREQEAEQAQQAELLRIRDEYVDEAIDYIADATKQKFTDHEQKVMGNLAIAMTGDDGVPDVQAAYNALYGQEGVLETRRSQWIDSKLGAHQAPPISAIPADKRPKTPAQRVAYIDERMRALADQQ